MTKLNRRTFIKASGLCIVGPCLMTLGNPILSFGAATQRLVKSIPSTNTPITAIGMGTWQTFNVGSDTRLRAHRCHLLQRFFEHGGQLIDSSPMYGSSHTVLGHCLAKMGTSDKLMAADKIWTSDGNATRSQHNEITTAWQQPRIDLMQVHNLLRWEEHLDALRDLKSAGKIAYIGVTTSHGRRHDALEHILKTVPLDFVQLTYNLKYRSVEQRLLPIARDKGIAVIANRPFDGGNLPKSLQHRNTPLPPWAADINCNTWPELLLKFIISHPAITCAIPATTQLEHMDENMQAATGTLLDKTLRKKLISYYQAL